MKKIILILLLLTGTAMSQYSLKIRLVEADGTPNTGQASNIAFCRYPHSSVGSDAVSGITVTEVGTAGNYVAYGFTTYEHVTLWLSGVKQAAFDSTQVGNLLTYLSSNYWQKNASQSGITGNKTITSGDYLKLGGTETWYKPYMYSSSPWATDYSLPSTYSLIWQGYADSVYGIKIGYYDGSNFRLNTSTTLLGRTSTLSPIGINTYDFNYSGDALSLDFDGSLSDSLRVRKDTIISENTYSKFWVLKRRFWSQRDSSDLFWYYRNTYVNTTDSFAVINKISSVDNETSVSLQYDGSVAKIDSVYLSPGTYMISFGFLWERPNHNDEAQINIADTVILALKEESSAPNSYIVNNIRHIESYTDTTNFSGGELSWSTSHTVYSTGKYIYLYGKYVANALSTALGLGPTASIKRGRIIATLVK